MADESDILESWEELDDKEVYWLIFNDYTLHQF